MRNQIFAPLPVYGRSKGCPMKNRKTYTIKITINDQFLIEKITVHETAFHDLDRITGLLQKLMKVRCWSAIRPLVFFDGRRVFNER